MDGEWRTKYKKCSVIDHRLFGILPRFLEGSVSDSLDAVENTRTEIVVKKEEEEEENEKEKEKDKDKEKEKEKENLMTEISNIFISEECSVDELNMQNGEDSLTSSSSLKIILPVKHLVPTDLKTETETEIEGKINIGKIGAYNTSSDLEPCILDSFLDQNFSDKSSIVCSHIEETEQDPFIALSDPSAVLPASTLSSSSPSFSSSFSVSPPLSLLSSLSPIPSLLTLPSSPLLSPPRCTSPHFSSPSSSSSTSTSSSRSSRFSSSSTIDFNTLHESLSGDVIDDVIKRNWPNASCVNDQPLTLSLKGLKNNENTTNSSSTHRGVEWVNERSEGDEEGWSERNEKKNDKKHNHKRINENENESRGSNSLLAVQKPPTHLNDVMDSKLITDSSTFKDPRTDSTNGNMHADTITDVDVDLKNIDGEETKGNFFSDKYNDGSSDRCGVGQQVTDISVTTAVSSHHTVYRNLTVNKPSRRPLLWNLLGDKTQFCPIPSYAQAFINSKRGGGMLKNIMTSCIREEENDVKEKEKDKDKKEIEKKENASSCSHSTALLFKKHYKHSIQLLGMIPCSVTPAVRTIV